jgi:Bardet-Biedl syndrome 1 protein
VHGLGPTFRLLIEVQNTSLDRFSNDMLLVLLADVRIYRIKQTCIAIPFLVPGMCSTFGTQVEMISELNLTDSVRVHIMRSNDPQPVVSAIIAMPASEPIV